MKYIVIFIYMFFAISMIAGNNFNESDSFLEQSTLNSTRIQYEDSVKVEFEDEVFENYLLQNFDVNGDSMITVNEAILIKEILCNDMNIKSLKGIEYFRNLTRLWCCNNQLTSIDLSHNTILEVLSVKNNDITSINLKDNKYVWYLDVEDNMLTSIDISNCNDDIIFYCKGNPMETIFVSPTQDVNKIEKPEGSSIELYYFAFEDKNFEKYLLDNFDTDIDGKISIFEAILIKEILCNDMNINSLKGIEYFRNLTRLWCCNNHLTSLDLSHNTILEVLSVKNNEITSINLKDNKYVWYLDVEDNMLTSIDISNCNDDIIFYCKGNPMETIFVSPTQDVNKIEKSDSAKIINAYISIEDEYLRNYILLNFDINFDGRVSFEEAKSILNIEIDNDSILSLNGIENFQNLKALYCHSKELVSVNLSNNKNLIKINLSNSNLGLIDLSNNTELQEVDLSNTQLSEIDIRNNKNIKYLNISNNYISDLDLSENVYLEELNCFNNNLSSLDISNNPVLKQLFCDNNPLTIIYKQSIQKIDILQAPYDVYLKNIDQNIEDENFGRYLVSNFDENRDGEISIFELENVVNIDCSNKSINSLAGLEYCINLQTLDCSRNNLTVLDISKNSKMRYLKCEHNSLTSLDLRKNPCLEQVFCDYNPLTLIIMLKTQFPYMDTPGGVTFEYLEEGDTAINKVYNQEPSQVIVSLYGRIIRGTPQGLYIQNRRKIIAK